MMTRLDSLDDDAALCAHDLRGALAVITGYVDLLQRPDLTEADRTRAFSGIEAAIRRARALLDDLAGLSGPRGAGERVDLTALAEGAAQDAHAASGRTILVTAHSAPTVRGDGVSIARVLQNLLDNAVRYAPAGDIDVSVEAEGGRAILEVADRGPGIPIADREHVLEPRARLERDGAIPGSGLGLAVVKSVVDGLGGELAIRDRPGGGAVMRVALPLA